MPGKTMTATEVERFVRSMEDQGVGVTRTKKGLLLRLPDGESTSVHFTNSDVRAESNLIARLRRSGVRHPNDPKDIRELPSNITDAQPVAPRSKRKIEAAVDSLGWPEVVTVLELIEVTDMTHVTVTRALYQMGFRPTKGKRGARDWLVPEEILAKRPEPKSDWLTGEAQIDRVAETESPTIEPVNFDPPLSDEEVKAYVEATKQEEREFIDTHDSWVLDLERLVGWPFSESISISQLRATMESAGLEVEIRVWRK